MLYKTSIDAVRVIATVAAGCGTLNLLRGNILREASLIHASFPPEKITPDLVRSLPRHKYPIGIIQYGNRSHHSEMDKTV
jgi:hypothetical protein